MKKTINGTTIAFYDDNDNKIMYMDYPHDECIWCFYSSDIIVVNKEDELYPYLEDFMNQEYSFNEDTFLKSYKDNNKLV